MVCSKCLEKIENPKLMFCPHCAHQLRTIPERKIKPKKKEAYESLLPILLGIMMILAAVVIFILSIRLLNGEEDIVTMRRLCSAVVGQKE